MKSATGKEIAKYSLELGKLYSKIMVEHTERCGCEWDPNTIGELLSDLERSMEQYHVRRKVA